MSLVALLANSIHPAIVLAPPLHSPRPHPASSMPCVLSQRWIEVCLASLYTFSVNAPAPIALYCMHVLAVRIYLWRSGRKITVIHLICTSRALATGNIVKTKIYAFVVLPFNWRSSKLIVHVPWCYAVLTKCCRPAHAVLAWYISCGLLSVCLSVLQPRAGIVSKRMDRSSYFDMQALFDPSYTS